MCAILYAHGYIDTRVPTFAHTKYSYNINFRGVDRTKNEMSRIKRARESLEQYACHDLARYFDPQELADARQSVLSALCADVGRHQIALVSTCRALEGFAKDGLIKQAEFKAATSAAIIAHSTNLDVDDSTSSPAVSRKAASITTRPQIPPTSVSTGMSIYSSIGSGEEYAPTFFRPRDIRLGIYRSAYRLRFRDIPKNVLALYPLKAEPSWYSPTQLGYYEDPKITMWSRSLCDKNSQRFGSYYSLLSLLPDNESAILIRKARSVQCLKYEGIPSQLRTLLPLTKRYMKKKKAQGFEFVREIDVDGVKAFKASFKTTAGVAVLGYFSDERVAAFAVAAARFHKKYNNKCTFSIGREKRSIALQSTYTDFYLDSHSDS